MKKIIKCACISSLITLLFIIWLHYFYKKIDITIPNNITIHASKSKNPASQGSEVWITSIFIDGHSIDLSEIPLNEGQHFRYNAIVLDGNSYYPTINLSFPEVPKVSAIIYFTMHDYSGTAIIQSSGTTESLDLYSLGYDNLVYSVKPFLTISDFLNEKEYFIISIICFCLLFFLTYNTKDRFINARIFVSSYLLIGLLFILSSADIIKWSSVLLQLCLTLIFSGFVRYVFIPIYKKVRKNVKRRYYIIIMSIFSVCSAYILLYYSDLNYQLLRNKNLIDNYPILLSLHSKTVNNSFSNEAWINSVVIDRKNIPLNKLLTYSDNWELKEDNRLFCNTSPNYISFPESTTLPLSINFLFHPYSGEIIADFNGHSKILQLYDQETAWDFINFKNFFIVTLFQI